MSNGLNADRMGISLKQRLTRNLLNIPGWRTQRKIVVFESDDWGSIRMASKQIFDHFLKKNFPVDRCPYNSCDSLECNDDLEMLFDVLSGVKDKNGNPAIITANNIVANPDFESIRSGHFQQYHWEPFTETLKRYPKHDRVYDLYKQGLFSKVFKPQFHGREHLNVGRWMKDLQSGDKYAHLAFDKNMFSIHTEFREENKDEYMDALGSTGQIDEYKKILLEGLNLFETLWGYKSRSFIAPCYTWHPLLEDSLQKEGVLYLQGIVVQKYPVENDGYKQKKVYHYQGQRNAGGQRYLIRNAFFEPAIFPEIDWVSDCLNRIETGFKWHKPVIIGSHRLNFIGYINPKNRDRNLKLLCQLLNIIQNRWPDVEFMSSDQLGDIMNSNNDVNHN